MELEEKFKEFSLNVREAFPCKLKNGDDLYLDDRISTIGRRLKNTEEHYFCYKSIGELYSILDCIFIKKYRVNSEKARFMMKSLKELFCGVEELAKNDQDFIKFRLNG